MNNELIFSLLSELNHLCSQDQQILEPLQTAIAAAELSRQQPLIVIQKVFVPIVIRIPVIVNTVAEISSDSSEDDLSDQDIINHMFPCEASVVEQSVDQIQSAEQEQEQEQEQEPISCCVCYEVIGDDYIWEHCVPQHITCAECYPKLACCAICRKPYPENDVDVFAYLQRDIDDDTQVARQLQFPVEEPVDELNRRINIALDRMILQALQPEPEPVIPTLLTNNDIDLHSVRRSLAGMIRAQSVISDTNNRITHYLWNAIFISNNELQGRHELVDRTPAYRNLVMDIQCVIRRYRMAMYTFEYMIEQCRELFDQYYHCGHNGLN